MTDIGNAPGVYSNGWRPEPMSERVVVRCYSSYVDAKRAVDRLLVARIPPARITVMGRGFRWREMFTAARVLKASAAAGAVMAGASALALWFAGGLDASYSWIGALVAGAVIGAALGGPLGAVAWMIARKSASVPETGHVDIDQYNVLVETTHAERARELLDG
jgi:hypothetical protein